MKYKVTIGGVGSEVFVHSITDEQVTNLKKLDLENRNSLADQFDIANAIGKDYMDNPDHTLIGPYYDSKYYLILVHDENDNLIWESDNNHQFENIDYRVVFENEKTLIIEDHIKGEYFDFYVEDDKFDPSKLKPIVMEISERIEIITGFIYDEKKIEEFNEWLDHRSKGVSFYLND
jgi:hypothetical protein